MTFSDILRDYPPYRSICENLDKTPVSAAGISESAQAHLIYSLCGDTGRPAIAVTYSDSEARALRDEIALFSDTVFHFPERDYFFTI